MIIIHNITETTVSIYGAEGWNGMTLTRVQDGKVIDIPLIDLSLNDRFGTFIFKYSDEVELNTAILDGNKTLYNLIPGLYYFEEYGIRGTLKIEGNKNDNKVYEQETNTSKIYEE